MKANLKFLSGILGFIVLVSPSAALAQTTSATRPGQMVRKAIMETRCTIAESRIEYRINRFNELKDDHEKLYQRIKNSLSDLADKLDSLGYDTTQIRADYKVLDEKIVKRAQDYASFIVKLETTKDYACGESEGQFVAALGEARRAMLTVRQDTVDIRTYYAQVIRPDIQALRAQKPGSNENAN